MPVESTAYPLSGTRVLVVEDEYYLADDLSRALEQAGAVIVGPAGSLNEAKDQVARRGFDCAVLDMNLRGDMAFSLADDLRQAQIPFVIATGYGDSSIPESLQDAPRIEKPYSVAKLVEMIGSLPRVSAARA